MKGFKTAVLEAVDCDGFESRLSLAHWGNSSAKNRKVLVRGWVPSDKFYFVWPIVCKIDCWLYNYINN